MNVSERLDQIEAQTSLGTEGPWTVSVLGHVWANPGEPTLVATAGWIEDAQAIAALRTVTPALIASVRAALAVHAEHLAPLIRSGRLAAAAGCTCVACDMARALTAALDGAS